MSDLSKALMVAILVHADQRDKQGEPYLLHVVRVVEAVGDDAKHVAALHDVLEDGKGWENDCTELLDEDEYQALSLLTRVPDEGYTAYIANMADRPERPFRIAREIKLADLRDNLRRIPPEPQDEGSRCEGRGVLNPGSGSGCGYCTSTGFGRERVRWHKTWTSLKDRYEKAIATLEATA